MSHHTHDTPDAEGHDHPHSQGEGEGFFEKVKEFFTGPSDDRVADDERLEGDVHTPTADEGWGSDAPTAADAPITDSVADSTESVDSTESGWDGSDEPPELAAPGNEAVAAYSDASADDGADRSDALADDGSASPLEDSGNEALAAYSDASAEDGAGGSGEESDYASRHGSGVDDSGVLADAPLEDSSDSDPRAAGAAEESGQADGWSEGEARSDGDRSDGVGSDQDRSDQDGSDQDRSEEEERERARREEEFAREHDPATHDVAAGEEFRQRGDWTADEHGGPQVQEPDGTVHDPEAGDQPGSSQTGGAEGSSEGTGWDDASGPGESGPDDVRDGGHGWGSAAPIEGGAMPLGHPVKAWHDTMTFVMPGEDGYEGSAAHEWFVDAEAAQRAGFRHAHGG